MKAHRIMILSGVLTAAVMGWTVSAQASGGPPKQPDQVVSDAADTAGKTAEGAANTTGQP